MRYQLVHWWRNLREAAVPWVNPWRQIRLLRAENELLAKTIADPIVTGIQMGNGTFTIEMETKAAKLMAGMFMGMFQRSPPDKKNYIEATFGSPMGNIVVTVMQPQGKTPHQLLLEAQRELATARDDLQNIRAELR